MPPNARSGEIGIAARTAILSMEPLPEVLVKHFLLEGQHLVPFEQRDPALVAAHRSFLQQGYDAGRFLLSGPSIPPAGGILIARAQSREELDAFLADEPFCKAKVMCFARITEFEPVQHQPVLKEWFGEA